MIKANYIKKISAIIEEEEYAFGQTAILDLDFLGQASELYAPTTMYSNGCTMVVGRGGDSGDVIGRMLKYDSQSDLITINESIGSVDLEPDNPSYGHSIPTINFFNTNLIFFRTLGHGTGFEVLESTSETDIQNFTTEITAATSFKASGYNQTFIKSGNFYVLNRNTDENAPAGVSFFLQLFKSNGADLSSFSSLKITSADFSGEWHYPWKPYKYGTSTKDFWGINHRTFANSNFYGISIGETIDQETFSNSTGTPFDRDVIISPITSQELEDNFIQFGSDANNSVYEGRGKGIQINDTLIWGRSKVMDPYPIYKIENRVNTTINTPFKYDDRDIANIDFRWNGSNLVYLVYYIDNSSNVTIEVWGSNEGLTVFENLYKVPIEYNRGFVIPMNLDEIPDGDKYIIVMNNTPGISEHMVTSNKFYLS